MCKPKIMPFISRKWEEKIQGLETAFYVIKHYEQELAVDWNSPSTWKQYGEYIQMNILPLMNVKPLIDFSSQEIVEICEKLKEVKNRRTGKPLSVSTHSSMVRIVRGVLRLAMKYGICDDVMWLDKRVMSAKSYSEKRTEERTKLPKSLKVKVEKAVAKMLLNNPLMVGVHMALLLMFAFGLRNSEARGVVYGNIMKIGGRYYLASHSTPDDETATITIGGKTYNMYRLLPIPELVLPILLARKAYLEAEIDAGRIKLDLERGINSVNDFPIANSDQDWTLPCSAERLTREGRVFLREAAIEGSLIHYISEEMAENYSELVYGRERDLTAYVLRRTFGEHLRDCGCDLAQVERCMGHVQTDGTSLNSDFANPDKLAELTKLLSQRPLLNSIPSVTIINMAEVREQMLENVAEAIVEIPRKDYDTEYVVRVVSNVNHVPPKITLEPKGTCADADPYFVEYQTRRRVVTLMEKNARHQKINVVYDYQKQYR